MFYKTLTILSSTRFKVGLKKGHNLTNSEYRFRMAAGTVFQINPYVHLGTPTNIVNTLIESKIEDVRHNKTRFYIPYGGTIASSRMARL